MIPADAIDFIIVAFRNDPAELLSLSRALQPHARGGGRVILVANDDSEYSVPDGSSLVQGHGNVGFAAGVKLGVLQSAAPYIVIVNPDCVVTEPALTGFMAHLRPGCGILVPKLLTEHGTFDYYPYENWTFSFGRKWAESRCRRELSKFRGAGLPAFAKIPGAFLGMERKVALALDAPFDSAFFLYAEDRDLTDRARRAGIPISYLPDVEITHIGGQSGTSVSRLVETCKTDGALRVAYRRYGRPGAALFALDAMAVDAARWILRRENDARAHRSAIRRWARAGFADPGAPTARELRETTGARSTAEPRRPGTADRGQVLALWADNSAANLGLRVLAQGNAALVDEATNGRLSVDFQDFGPGDSAVSFGTRSILRDIGRRNGPIKSKLRQYDFAFDTGAGDSFADIYGLKRLAFIAYAHWMLRRLRIPLILGPQTIGPFNTVAGRMIARRSLKQAALVMTRDAASAEYASRVLGATVDVIGTDVVFMLPKKQVKARSRDVIVNVSGLLWFGDEHVDSRHYREQVRALIEGLEAEGRTVSLLAHVVHSSRGSDDVDAINAAVGELGRPDIELLVPGDLDEARSYIATSNVLVGARMHACLNALSQGVPAVPWAYSRKFEPLLAAVGWPYVLDVRETEDLAARTIEMIVDPEMSRALASQAKGVAAAAQSPVAACVESLARWLAEQPAAAADEAGEALSRAAS